MNENISPKAYSDIIYVPYDRSKSDFMYPNYPCMLIDDKEENLDECSKYGCHGILLSDTKTSKKYPNANTLEDIWFFYRSLIQTY